MSTENGFAPSDRCVSRRAPSPSAFMTYSSGVLDSVLAKRADAAAEGDCFPSGDQAGKPWSLARTRLPQAVGAEPPLVPPVGVDRPDLALGGAAIERRSASRPATNPGCWPRTA